MIRIKGLFWLATRIHFAGFLSQARAVITYHGMGCFWAAVPKKEWPEARKEIVLIGQNMDNEALTAMLDSCV